MRIDSSWMWQWIATAIAPLLWTALLVGTAAAQTPLDVASSEVAPSVFALPSADGNIEVAWRRSDGKIVFSTFSGAGWSTGKDLVLNTNLQLLGGFARDEAGNRYIAAVKDETANPQEWAAPHRANMAHVLRIPPAGDRVEILADVGLPEFSGKWPLINPIRMADGGTTNSEMVLNPRSGLLALAFGHNNGAANNVHQTGTLIGLDINGNSLYNGGAEQHPAQECLAVDGDGIVMSQVFDQGIGLSTLKRVNGKFVWSDYVLVYEITRPNPHSETLVVAGIIPTPNAYLLVFTTGTGWLWRQRGFDHGLDGGCTIKVMKVARDFDTLPKFRWPDSKNQQGNYPLTALAAPADGKSYVRPVVATLGNGEGIVAFEQWGRPNQQFGAPALDGVRAVRFNAQGAVQATGEVYPQTRIPRSTRAFSFPAGNRIGWVNGDAAGNRLVLHSIGTALDYRSYELGRGSIGPAGFTVRVTNSSATDARVDATLPGGGAGPSVVVKARETQSIPNLPDQSQLLITVGANGKAYAVQGADLAIDFAGFAPNPMPMPGNGFLLSVQNTSPDNVSVKSNGQRLGAVPFNDTRVFPARVPAGAEIVVSNGTISKQYVVNADLTIRWPLDGNPPPPSLRLEQLAGRYVRDNPDNGFHDGTLTVTTVAGGPPTLVWKNKDDVSWTLTPDLAKSELNADKSSPYYETNPDNGRKFKIEQEKNPDGTIKVTGFYFLDELYRRKD